MVGERRGAAVTRSLSASVPFGAPALNLPLNCTVAFPMPSALALPFLDHLSFFIAHPRYLSKLEVDLAVLSLTAQHRPKAPQLLL